jgi:hypothetical protein
MIEHREIQRRRIPLADLDPFDPANNVFEQRGVQTRLREGAAERVRVISDHVATQEGGFNRRRSASHERVVDDIAWLRETIDEKPRELSLETRSVGNLMQRRGLALFGGPELAGEPTDAFIVKSQGFYDEIRIRHPPIEETVDEVMIRSILPAGVCASWDRHGSGKRSGIGKLLYLLSV